MQRGWRGGAVALVLAAALALAGCASTRMTHFGPLTGGEPLVTLVVSEDPDVVRRECMNVATASRLLGCQMSRVVRLADADVRAVKIVRYTDALPSEMAFEIDAHELCHAIASVQGIDDPCHRDNGGVVQAYGSERRSAVLR